jgi:isocitrate lyase
VRSEDVKVLNIVFAAIRDRRGRSLLSVRDQNTFDPAFRRKGLMTLAQLFLIHRYRADAVHFVTPSADSQRLADGMKARGIFVSVADEVGKIIVADVDEAAVKALVAPRSAGLAAIVG